MRSRQVIDATRMRGEIVSARGGLTVQGRWVPLEDVGVLLLGNEATISGGALTMLAKYDVIVLNCDWRGVPDMVAYSWIDNSRVAARHRRQAELTQPRRKAAWQEIVKAKIRGQEQNLAHFGSSVAGQLERLRREVRSGDPANCEAQAARLYWDALFGDSDRFRRVPGAQDRLNSLLNYGYTVMRGFVIQAVAVAGLWPTYGIWHRNRSNTFALADDLIEPFRPALDFVVRGLDDEASLDDAAVKKALVAATSQEMDESGSTILTRMYDLTAALANYIEGERDRLNVPTWHPPAEPDRHG